LVNLEHVEPFLVLSDQSGELFQIDFLFYSDPQWSQAQCHLKAVVGDIVCRKGGKWYYEVVFSGQPTTATLGWITRDFHYNYGL
jgi:hypothetical protein